MSHKREQGSNGGGDDTQVSARILKQARNSILREVKLDRTFQVPYLAGYSRDGGTIYLDRGLPRTFKLGRRRVPVDEFLIFHEAIEKALVDELELSYQHAHQIALRAEEAAVLSSRIPWSRYQAFCKKHIERAYNEELTRVPPDLDLRPYRDEADRELLARMRVANGRRRGSKRARRERS